MRYLEEHGIGFDTGFAKVPLVCQSCIYDLGFGRAAVGFCNGDFIPHRQPQQLGQLVQDVAGNQDGDAPLLVQP